MLISKEAEGILKELVGITSKIQFCINKMIVSDDTALELLKYYTIEKQKVSPYLLTSKDINDNEDMPCMSVYSTRLGGLKNAYKLIGINYDEYNFNVTKSILMNEYMELESKINKTPTSRDIDANYLKGIIHNCKFFLRYFGTMKNLQTVCGFELTKHGYPDKTLDEMKDDLLKISKILGRVLENYNINFLKEEKYKTYINGFSKGYKFDFVLNINNKKCFVEIFGITGNKEYDIKTAEKIQVCKDNNLLLLVIYPSLLWSSKQKEIYDVIINAVQ